MIQNFSIESYIREYHRQRTESDAMNLNAVIAGNDIGINDYLAFLNPPGDFNDIQKYIAEHPALELREIISVHEPVECKNLINTGVIDNVEWRFIDEFDFHFLNFNFDIRHKKHLNLRSVAINARFNEPYPPNLRPRVIAMFPDHDLFDKSAKVAGKVVVSGGQGIKFYGENEFDQKKHAADADFVYDYNAKWRGLFSSQTGSGFFYKFFTEGSEALTQNFRAMAILLRPRAVKKILMKVSFVINEFPVEYDYVTDIPIEESKI